VSGFAALLRSNRNYRFTWIGQVVSEVGDHYNNIAVFSLVLANTGSGLVVAGILLARGCAVMLGGPIAGVLLDRMDRKRLMIASDLVRAVIALRSDRKPREPCSREIHSAENKNENALNAKASV